MVIFIVWIASILLQQKANCNRIKEYVKIKDFSSIMPSDDTKISEFNQ